MILNIRQHMPEDIGMRLVQKLRGPLDNAPLRAAGLDDQKHPVGLRPDNTGIRYRNHRRGIDDNMVKL